jgi:hypothetical protein
MKRIERAEWSDRMNESRDHHKRRSSCGLLLQKQQPGDSSVSESRIPGRR